MFADWGIPVFSDAKVGIIFELARGFSDFFSKMPKTKIPIRSATAILLTLPQGKAARRGG